MASSKKTPTPSAVALVNSTPTPPPVQVTEKPVAPSLPTVDEAIAFVSQFATLTDAQLKGLTKALRAELKARTERAEATRPQRGDKVLINSEGRFKGKVGTVVIARQSRAFVDVEGIKQPAYVLITELTKVAEG